MSWLDKEYEKRYFRIYRRDHRHPGWRQVFVDYGGMCAICGEVEGLEFHEPFGEDRGNNGGPKMQSRIPMCNRCHATEEAKRGITVNPRHYPSMLQQDVSWEIQAHGGYQQWLKDFGLEDKPGFVPANLRGENEH